MKKIPDYRFQRLYPDKFLEELTKQSYSYVRSDAKYPKFFFLCGKKQDSKEMTNRLWVKEFYKKHDNSIICIFAENLWEKESKIQELDLLTYESFLAEASDAILLFVESYGTACELGAFTIKDNLAKKIVVFNDSSYKNENSFLTEGPIKKIKNSNPENVIYSDLNAIFSKF
ncbi:hypothetical protein DXT63_17110 [Thermoanaerobacteraceae bacterium SP2]|nr:hypothetical protein DXT63_17110 [Thermoanaerobacteraceae bacterium SP2]